MIIVPVISMTFYFVSSVFKLLILQCSRCISSLSTTNRATNGHRFVFQSTKILETERHYIPNEMGIIPSGNNTVSSPQPRAYPVL